jgi:BlaI family penicillinase repressor
MKLVKPTDLEMQILSVLYERGPSTARAILESMPDGKSRAYTTILSAMQVMEKKGFLKHETSGKTHIFRPAKSKKQIVGPFVRKVVTEIFAGKPAAMMQALLAGEKLSDAEIAEMREMLDSVENERRGSDA